MKELKKILKIIDEAPSQFEAQIPDIEKKIFRDVSLLLKDLKVSANGRIEANIENLKLINEIKTRLGKIVASKQYAKLVNEFVTNIPVISNFQTGTPGVPAASRKMMSAVAKMQIDNTLESLIGNGYKQEVVSKLYDTLLTNVTSGGSYSDMIERLEKQLITTEQKPGMLSKYAKTYVTDALGQFAGQGNKMIADALKSEWFQYVGSNLTTTREFCEHLTKKRYVHISEFPTLLRGKIDGHQCKIYEATGLPYGMKEGTNVDNLIENRGGWNCGHALMPTAEWRVPQEVRDRVKNTIAHRMEYERLTKDKNYTDVRFNEETGALQATHVEHNFQKEIGVFGIERGNYEKFAVEALYNNGDKVVLESEAHKVDPITGKPMKRPDGYLNGKVMDIKGVESDGETSIRNSLLSAKKQKVEACVLYFHDASMYSRERVISGWNDFKDYVSDKDFIKNKNLYISEIICVVDGNAIRIPIK